MPDSPAPDRSRAGTPSQHQMLDKKGESTRARILEHAYELAGSVGLEGLTIGVLASELQLSKSGLFAHFGSKESLQIAVLEHAARHFEQVVFRPALEAPRGTPRLRALFERWLTYVDGKAAQGCVFMSAAMNWDDRDGPVRAALVEWFRKLHQLIEHAFTLAIQSGHLPATSEPSQLASEFHAFIVKYHVEHRLLHEAKAKQRALAALERLLQSPPSPAEQA